MAKPTIRALARFAWVTALCLPLHAQTGKTISILLLDGKTGQPITPSNFLVRIDHENAVHNEWLRINDDGTAQVTLPAYASLLSMQATYDASMDIYINCDAAKEKVKDTVHWYAVADILKTGVTAPNECGKATAKAKPGEFVFFVRKRGWRDAPEE
jgi:hypothetical protein